MEMHELPYTEMVKSGKGLLDSPLEKELQLEFGIRFRLAFCPTSLGLVTNFSL